MAHICKQLFLKLNNLRSGESLLRIGILLSMVVSFHAHAQIANNNCKFLGNIIASSVPADFGKYWNQVTPENSGKWASAEPARDEMDWAQLDLAYEYAKSNGFPFKHHTFVWGQQQPDWLSGLTATEQRDEVEEWIKLYSERYPDTDFVDVVNEPLHAPPAYAAALGGAGSTGWDWVIWSFEKARQYLPNAKLILNDYNIINNNAATTDYIEIIQLLKDRGLIDYIGEQGHFLETTPGATITSNLNRLFQTNLPILISEYDVNIANDTEQRNKYQEQFPLLWEHPGVRGVTLWGYKQGQIWRTDAYLVRSANTERPALTWLKSYVAGTTADDFCGITSAEDNESSGLSVYPNPANNGLVTIESTEVSRVVVRDVAGKMIRTLNLSPNQPSQIQLSPNPGLYILTFSGKRAQRSRKLVVK